MDQSKINKDHKQIGQELELFFTDDIAPGAPFWLPKGMIIFKELEKYIRELTSKAGYQETSTPIMVKSELFKQSGHWIKFGTHNMYNLPLYEDEEIEEIKKDPKKAKAEGKIDIFQMRDNETPVYAPMMNYSLKPMNCPDVVHSCSHIFYSPSSLLILCIALSEISINSLRGILSWVSHLKMEFLSAPLANDFSLNLFIINSGVMDASFLSGWIRVAATIRPVS